jgi:hypothetical protein
MPEPETRGGINLDFFFINDLITNYRSEEKLFHLDIGRLNAPFIELKSLFVREPHSHEVSGQQKSCLQASTSPISPILKYENMSPNDACTPVSRLSAPTVPLSRKPKVRRNPPPTVVRGRGSIRCEDADPPDCDVASAVGPCASAVWPALNRSTSYPDCRLTSVLPLSIMEHPRRRTKGEMCRPCSCSPNPTSPS